MEVGQGQAASMESDSGAGNKDTLFSVGGYCGFVDSVVEWDQ